MGFGIQTNSRNIVRIYQYIFGNQRFKYIYEKVNMTFFEVIQYSGRPASLVFKNKNLEYQF